MVAAIAPAGSAVHAWCAALAAPAVPVVVFVPGTDDAAVAARLAATPDTRVVACLPVVRDDHWFVADDALAWTAVRADAYAPAERQLAAAVAHVAGEDRAARAAGPLRLTYVGALGALQQEPAIGQAFPVGAAVGDPIELGRSPGVAIQLGIGHSDQSIVARRHARLTRTAAGLHVVDLGTTSGTWLDGARATEGDLAPGAELAVAGMLRFRLDGAA